jgi:glutathione peroxidase
MSHLYDVALTTLDGQPATLRDYAGKVLLIVNVASKCGFTKQYTALEALYQKDKDRGLVVLGFPSNDFAGQEPGSDQDIANFCSVDYPVTFPLFSKVSVNGPGQHPVYAALTSAMPQHDADAGGLRNGLDSFLTGAGLPPTLPLPAILWNFEKFVLGRDGTVLARFAADVTPDDTRLTSVIEKALA